MCKTTFNKLLKGCICYIFLIKIKKLRNSKIQEIKKLNIQN